MKFCSNCGSKVTLTELPDDIIPRFYCRNCKTVHYLNPKMVVGCVVLNAKEEVLLCRRGIEPRKNLWNLPCGYLENGETVEEGALRETREEACIEVELRSLHSIYSLPTLNQVYVHFEAGLKNGNPSPGLETLETVFLKEKEIPWNELAFSSTAYALRKQFDKYTSPPYIGAFHK